MPKTYVISKTNWLGTRFLVSDEAGRAVYAARVKGMGFLFTGPDSVDPVFELRSKSFLSSKLALVESSVEYEVGFVRPVAPSGTWALIQNVAEEDVAFLVEEGYWTRFEERRAEFETAFVERTISEVFKRVQRMRPGLKESFSSAVVSGKTYLVISNAEKIAGRFSAAKDKRSIVVEILDDSERYLDWRMYLCLGLRCLAAQYKNNGA